MKHSPEKLSPHPYGFRNSLYLEPWSETAKPLSISENWFETALIFDQFSEILHLYSICITVWFSLLFVYVSVVDCIIWTDFLV
jgi:hypothetical protein